MWFGGKLGLERNRVVSTTPPTDISNNNLLTFVIPNKI
jgi:hypothetical protein